MMRWLFGLLALGAGTLALSAQESKDGPKKPVPPALVPYKLTTTQHVMVRAKINGKGPFNFIVDTGAPIMFVATKVGKQIGLQDEKGWATIDRLELEGGLVQEKVKVRVETPFQLEGMNGMGMAGAELHGILGYTVLAKYRMEFDFTKDNLRWTPLAEFTPPPPQAIGGGGGGGQGGLEMIGTLMKFMGPLLGMKPATAPTPRGYLGVELEDVKDQVRVKTVLKGGPADNKLQAGDVIMEVGGKSVSSLADVRRLTARILSGQEVRFKVLRGQDEKELTINAGEGL